MDINEVLELLKSMKNEQNRAGMARFGINVEKAFGISMKQLYPIARKIKKNHNLAFQLWETGFHEARLLAIIIAEPKLLTSETMDRWTQDFNSWDICDQAAMKLYSKMPNAWEKVELWAKSEAEFVRRAAFALIAALSHHYKLKDNTPFEKSLMIIKEYCTDERNFVKKAVNWALREIGKRNYELYLKAKNMCIEILEQFPSSRAARWIAKDALRELESHKIIERVKKSKFN